MKKIMKTTKCPRCKEENVVPDDEPYYLCKSCGKKCNNSEFIPLDLGCGLE